MMIYINIYRKAYNLHIENQVAIVSNIYIQIHIGCISDLNSTVNCNSRIRVALVSKS